MKTWSPSLPQCRTNRSRSRKRKASNQDGEVGESSKDQGNCGNLVFFLNQARESSFCLHITHIFDNFPLLVIDRLVLGLRGDPGEEGVQLPTGCLGLRPGELLGVYVSVFIQKITIFAICISTTKTAILMLCNSFFQTCCLTEKQRPSARVKSLGHSRQDAGTSSPSTQPMRKVSMTKVLVQ